MSSGSRRALGLVALFLCASISVLIPGCGGSPSVEGTWSGTATGAGGESGTVRLDLDQDGDSVTGSGELQEDEGSGGRVVFLSIGGGSVGDDGSVAMEATADGNQPVRIVGEVSGDTLEATLNTTGGDVPMALRREG